MEKKKEREKNLEIFVEDDDYILVPPKNFAMVEEGVYRSAYPVISNFSFLETLNLKSIVYLPPEPYLEEHRKFLQSHNIKLYQFRIEGKKAETSEDLHDWKNAIELAIAQAPSPTPVASENGVLNGEQADAAKGSYEQQKEKSPLKSTVIGRPILLALQDIDGSPSFLEKALKFIEEHGIRTEGILRQAADVEEVEKRVYEFEHGKT